LVFQSAKPIKNSSRITFYTHTPKIKIENEILQNFGDNQYWTYSLNLDKSTLSHEEIGAMVVAKQKKNGGHYADRMGRFDHLSANHFLRLSNANSEMLVSNHDALFVKLGKSEPQFLDENSAQINLLIGGQIDKDLKLGMYDQAGDTYFQNSFSFLPSSLSIDNSKAMRFSLEDQNPLIASKAEGTSGDLKQSLFSIQNPNIVLWSLKPGEDTGLLLRTWNTQETAVESNVKFSKSLLNAKQATHVETPFGALDVNSNSFIIKPKRQEMQSFLLEFK
jgi:alpha-mannosidase